MAGWRRAAVVVAVASAAAFGVRAWLILGPLHVTPTESRLSLRVGESVEFSAQAAGATGYTWSVWGRAVSHDRTWRYVPAPEDAGWQQVTVTAAGHGGRRTMRTWDVGVVANVPPALVDVTPPPGHVTAKPDSPATFRCGARVTAARSSDRLRFEWSINGQPVSHEERVAAAAASQFELPASAPGSYRVTVRVTEDDRMSSVAEWTVEVSPRAPAAPPPPPPAEVPPTVVAESPPPTVVAEAAPSPSPALRQLVRTPAPWRVDAEVGERIVFRSGLAPETGEASYEWKVDGRNAKQGNDAELVYRPPTPGTHRVVVTVRANSGAIGIDAWRLQVTRARVLAVSPPIPAPPEAAPPRLARQTPPPPRPKEKTKPPEPAPPTREAAVQAPPPEPAEPPRDGIGEAEVRRWLEEYAHAWSRRDVAALKRMGQVRSDAEAARLLHYFGNVQELHVDVRFRSLRVDGDRAAVEFERIDTVTDPAGLRQELRLPIQHKELERVSGGLRFVE